MLYQQPVSSSSFITKPLTVIQKPAEQPKDPPKAEEYYTLPDEYLEKIASDHHMTTQRLFNKNLDISDPNHLDVGQKLLIPAEAEVLADRPMPVTISNASERVPEQKISPQTLNPGGFSSSGNLYSYGYCTFGVKNWRPDIPNTWGNADTWLINAQADGWATGDSPKVGAIGVARSYGHVVQVLSINGSSVHIREENYQGWNIVSERDAPISEFAYIY